jgi:hypothetical protein
MKEVGIFTQKIIEQLNLNLPSGTPIFIGETNEAHIKSRHPYEYERYYERLPDILQKPDYIGINPKDGSIQFIKEFCVDSEYIRVAVKITHNTRCFVKTLHLLSTCNADRYIQNGTIKKLDID